MASCTDEWDDHYAKRATVVNNTEMSIVDSPAEDYLKSQSEYSTMYALFEETGVIKEMEEKGVSYTLFVIPDEKVTKSSNNTLDGLTEDEKIFKAKSQITTAALSPSVIEDGQRLTMWNGKYVTINKVVSEETGEEEILFNDECRVNKVVKVNNGFIYELDQLIVTPKSLMEVIEELSDDYSIFKNAVLSHNVNTFDKSNSLSIGVDKSGNTVYDSVFTVTNPYFEAQGLDLFSESTKTTVFIPSDEQINNALSVAKEKLKTWRIERPDSVLENWCFQAMFFKNVEYGPEDFGDEKNPDFTSAFSKQWRTTVNKVDLDNPIKLSNGVAYYVTSLKLPTKDVLMWRFKDLFKWYKYMTQEDKDKYFICTNMTPYSGTTRTEVKAWTPGGGWPMVSNEYLWLTMSDTSGYTNILDFTAFKFDLHDDNSYDVEPYIVPPGEYTLHLGAGKVANMKNDCKIYINDKYITEINRASWKNYSHDRSGGGQPENYNLSNTKYDRDGAQVATFTIEGDEPVELHIRFEAKINGGSGFTPEHWCIRPTANNY